MNHSPNSHSRMFLMELIISILFFSLAGAICLRMFAVSRKMSDDTTALNMAMNQASNVAELLKYAQSENEPFPGCMLGAYPYTVTDTAQAAIYFDEGWNHCETHNAVYSIQVTQQDENNGIIPFGIAVWDTTDSNAAIYTLDLKLHAPIQP